MMSGFWESHKGLKTGCKSWLRELDPAVPDLSFYNAFVKLPATS